MPSTIFFPLVLNRREIQLSAGWGVCLPSQVMWQVGMWTAERTLELLQPDCWHTWSIWPACDFPGRVPMVWSEEFFNREAVRLRMQERSECWFVLNEPERDDQANTAPADAVRLVNEMIALAHETNTGCAVALPSVCPNAGDHDGLAWLEEYMRLAENSDAGNPSYLTCHGYSSTTPAALQASVDKMRLWMARHGLDGCDLSLNEFCAHNEEPSVQMDVMDAGRRMLNDGVIASAFWFDACSRPGETWTNASLCDLDLVAKDASLSLVGRHWKNLQHLAVQDS